MSQRYIPKALRELIAAQAKYRCGYCLTQEEVIGMPMEVDHLIPVSQQGPTTEENLWLACSSCNDAKNKRTTGRDLLTGEQVSLFNPRNQVWSEHFAWTLEKDKIIGLTAIGRATIVTLNMNNFYLVRSRKIWAKARSHPPEE